MLNQGYMKKACQNPGEGVMGEINLQLDKDGATPSFEQLSTHTKMGYFQSSSDRAAASSTTASTRFRSVMSGLIPL